VRVDFEEGFQIYAFFFSSRRRHTRSKRDWSSDVCSSDLGNRNRVGAPQSLAGFRIVAVKEATCGAVSARHPGDQYAIDDDRGNRSEERRVGKECRSRWWRWQCKKKANKKCTATKHR